MLDLRALSTVAFSARLVEMSTNKKTTTQLAKMSIDQKFVELTADVLEIYIFFI